jgi:DNA-binding response OmpR family regulator
MSYRILIVEDEPGMIELLTVALEDEGYVISIANNGHQGLRKVEEEHPDLIISDVMMPDMNGYDFCEQLRANPKTAAIPFIFLTAKKDVSDRVRGLNLGADDYISKPFMLSKSWLVLKRDAPGTTIASASPRDNVSNEVASLGFRKISMEK